MLSREIQYRDVIDGYDGPMRGGFKQCLRVCNDITLEADILSLEGFLYNTLVVYHYRVVLAGSSHLGCKFCVARVGRYATFCTPLIFGPYTFY